MRLKENLYANRPTSLTRPLTNVIKRLHWGLNSGSKSLMQFFPRPYPDQIKIIKLSFTVNTFKTLGDRTKTQRTDIVENDISYKKVLYDIFLTSLVWSWEQWPFCKSIDGFLSRYFRESTLNLKKISSGTFRCEISFSTKLVIFIFVVSLTVLTVYELFDRTSNLLLFPSSLSRHWRKISLSSPSTIL